MMKNQMTSAVYEIERMPRFSGKPGLHRIKALMQALGNPQEKLRFVHVAGSNGKGSVCTMIAEILQCAGLRTGLFTSPYLVQFHERIRVQGEMISDAALTELYQIVRQAEQTLSLPEGEKIGHFEFVFAVALLYFVQQKCEIVVLETGLGGAHDASNVIPAPLAAVITSISLEHTAVLGSTYAEIAATKAGIIKPGSRVICAPGQPPEAEMVIRKACEAAGAPCEIPGQAEVLSQSLAGTSFRCQSETYYVKLIGEHQVQNALAALHTVQALRAAGLAVSRQAVTDGLARARIAGRLEFIQENPLFLLDGAHNPDGMRALCQTLDKLLKGRRLLVIFGVMQDKAVEAVTRQIAARADIFFAAKPEGERALDDTALAAIASQACAAVYACGSAAQAVQAALAEAGEKDVILACGSLYLIGEIKKEMQ